MTLEIEESEIIGHADFLHALAACETVGQTWEALEAWEDVHGMSDAVSVDVLSAMHLLAFSRRLEIRHGGRGE